MAVYVNTVEYTQGSQYTITPNGNQYPCVGGNVVFTGGNTPPNFAALLFIRVLTLTQNTALQVEAPLSNATLENTFDRTVMQIQQLENQIDLCLQLPITSQGDNTTLPTPVAGDVLGWDAFLDITNYTPAQIVANAVPGTSGVFGPSSSIIGSIATFNSLTGSLLASTPADSGAIFGGMSNIRPLPTSGTIQGEYWHYGNWVQTGAITSSQARIHMTGTMTINDDWTAEGEASGGAGGLAATGNIAPGQTGAGLAPGTCASGSGNNSYLAGFGGGGAGHGGQGGSGGSYSANEYSNNGGGTYVLSALLMGSGGAGGCGVVSGSQGGNGGAGGGSIYIECTGNINFTSSAAMAANGGNASAGGGSISFGGGGGSGGGIQIRSLGIVALATGATITANGGTGGNSSNGAVGGGGGGGIIDISGTAVNNSGTITAAGGGSGTTAGFAANPGSTGIVSLNNYIQNVRSAG